jgi:uncharacterized membrane protein YheB (UPF0754 family)
LKTQEFVDETQQSIIKTLSKIIYPALLTNEELKKENQDDKDENDRPASIIKNAMLKVVKKKVSSSDYLTNAVQ